MKTVTYIYRDLVLHSNLLAKSSLSLLLACGLLLCSAETQAATIYDNSSNDLMVRMDPGTLEVGDQIVLAGTARYLTNFSFEYWGTSLTPGAFAGNVEVSVRFYMNNGALYNGYATPGTKFYDSGWFSVQPTERNVLEYTTPVDFSPDGLLIPVSDMTWSVQFRGMGLGDAAGVDLYGPATAGQNYPDYWVRTLETGWQLRTNSATDMNFAGKFEASPSPVVTPPTMQISTIPGKVVVSWPGWAQNYELWVTSQLAGAPWTLVNSGIYFSNEQYVFTNNITPAGNTFFRLQKMQ